MIDVTGDYYREGGWSKTGRGGQCKDYLLAPDESLMIAASLRQASFYVIAPRRGCVDEPFPLLSTVQRREKRRGDLCGRNEARESARANTGEGCLHAAK